MIEDYIAELYKVKTEKEKLQAKVKDLNEQEEYLEGMIIDMLRGQGLLKGTSKLATVSIKTEVYPVVKDWDEVFGYISETKDFSILKKGINSAVWREAIANEVSVPGIQEHEKDSLLFRRKPKIKK